MVLMEITLYPTLAALTIRENYNIFVALKQPGTSINIAFVRIYIRLFMTDRSAIRIFWLIQSDGLYGGSKMRIYANRTGKICS